MKSQPELFTFANGLRVLGDFMPERESVAIGVWTQTGSRYEPVRIQGISHFLEHMLFKGSFRRTGKRISQEIEGLGGTLNGFTSEECTCYWVKARAKYFHRALNVLLDMYFHPRLEPEDIAKEKQVVKEEIRMYWDNPAYHVSNLIQKTMWPNQPLGRSTLGTEETIDRLLRNDLISYKKSQYQLDRTIVVVCGNVPMSEVLPAVKDNLISRRISRSFGSTLAKYNRSRDNVTLEKRDIEQTHLCLGVEGLPRLHPQRYALTLLNIILGGNMSSRLFQEVRENRGWAYSIRSDLDLYRDTGAVVVSAGLHPDRVEDCLKVIVKQFAALTRRPPSQYEFARAREYYCGQTALSLEQTVSRMLWLGENLICAGEVLTLQEVFHRISKLKPENISEVAGVVFRPHRSCLALVGPVKTAGEVVKFANLLKHE